MCGIATIIDPVRWVPPGTINLMLAKQHRRGPDASGVVNCRSVTLGHQLLKILPCSNSRQPMITDDGHCAISFNGEIYNFRQLKKQLEKNGVRFNSHTDTEVILELYRREGLTAFKQLNGMFACVIHDRIKGMVYLVRDRFGQKPLFYRQSRGAFFISSSIRSLILPEIGETDVDDGALQEYLLTLNTFDHKSLFSGVYSVPAGCCIAISEGGRQQQEICIEKPMFNSTGSALNIDQAAAELWSRFQASVELQSHGVDNVAAHLSGGLDSSAIVVGLHQYKQAPFTTYSCSYEAADSLYACSEEMGFEELVYAREVAGQYGLPNRPVRIRPDDYIGQLLDIVDTLEEPKGNPCLPHYMLARSVSMNHRIVLSGEGADELLGGYPWKLQAIHADSSAAIQQALFAKQLTAPLQIVNALYSDTIVSSQTVHDAFSRTLSLESFEHALDAVMYYDIQMFLQYLLLQADRLASRFSIEARYPFLERQFADFALSLPAQLRFGGMKNAKPVLRKALQKRLPDSTLARKKIGFVPPEGSWYRDQLRKLVKTLLLSADSYVASLCKPGSLHQLWQNHLSGRHNFRKLIWGLLVLEVWHRRQIQQIPAHTLKEQIDAAYRPKIGFAVDSCT